jgi:hypothetical protein
MTRQDRNSIFATFCVGFVAGVYFYFTGFTFEIGSDVPDESFYTDFSIEGKAYGDCDVENCLSFQLLADGSYRLNIDSPKLGTVTKNGIIDKSLKDELMKNFNVKTLEKQSIETSSHNCASDNKGIDYNFVITKGGEKYELDTCYTNVDYKSDAWNNLAELWSYFDELK